MSTEKNKKTTVTIVSTFNDQNGGWLLRNLGHEHKEAEDDVFIEDVVRKKGLLAFLREIGLEKAEELQNFTGQAIVVFLDGEINIYQL